MNFSPFKAGLVLLALAMSSIKASGQSLKFIYLQTENKEPFYVKLDKKVLNSSESGYLIIPKLTDNTYSFIIGFYDAGSPEINTTIRVKDSNLGLILRSSGDKGWGIQNLQTLQPLAIKVELPAGREEKSGPYTNEFTRILAEVVGEPSIAWAPGPVTTPEVVLQPVKSPDVKKETVSVKPDTVATKKPDAPAVTVSNSNCKKTASQNDYIKLRKQMAGAANEKDMIKAANKQFLNTCFTTEQVMNLGILFINEEEKYKFFVAAYPHVSDNNNFARVKDMLTDNYFKTRLDAMIKLK